MPEEKKEVIRRAPAVETKISQLGDAKGRVALLGTVVSKNPELYSFVIDDTSGGVLVLVNNVSDFEKVQEGQLVRVMGRVWGEGEEVEVQADIVQDFSKLDKDLYKKVYLSA